MVEQAPELLPPFVAPIVKVNHACNLACEYCFYKGFVGRDPHTIPWEVVTKTIDGAAEYNLARGHRRLTIHWHGGEPLLSGREFFQAAMDYERIVESHTGIQFENRMQTNGTLVDENWVEFFSLHQFRVGVSIDGPPSINDAQRHDVNGRGVTNEVLHGVRLLTDGGVNSGVITVLTNDCVGRARELYDFYQESRIDGLAFCKCVVNSGCTIDEQKSLAPSNYADFAKEFFDLFFDGSYRLAEREYRTALQSLLGKPNRGLCTMSGRRSCGMFPTVVNDGTVYFCDDYDDEIDVAIGNLSEESLPQIIAGERFERRKRDVVGVFQACSNDCDVASVCGGGCPRHDTPSGLNYYCPAYRELWPHVAGRVEKALAATDGGRADGRRESE